MPGGDKTGPMGQGPMTGRGAGNSGSQQGRGFIRARRGGFGRGRGGGFRHRHGQSFDDGRGRGPGFSPVDFNEEASELRAAPDRLRAQIESLEKRLARLEEKD